MSSAQVGVGLALAEISRAAVEPYRVYTNALRERHEVTGVSFEALKDEAQEGALFADFVSNVVHMLPPLETADLKPASSDKEYVKEWDTRNVFLLGEIATGFTSQDSVEAEAIGASIIWANHMPQYLVGSSKHNLLVAQPRLNICSAERYAHYVTDHIDRGSGMKKIGNFIAKSQLDYTVKALNTSSNAKIAHPIRGSYDRMAYYFASPGKTSPLSKEMVYPLVKSDAHFLALTTTDTSEKGLQSQAERLRGYFDAEQMRFVIDANSKPADAPTLNPYELFHGTQQEKPNYKFLNPREVAEYQVLERMTVLAVRFGKLEQFAGKLATLYASIADIRGETIRLEDQEYNADSSAQRMGEHVIALIQAAQAAEEQKTAASKTFKQRLGFGRPKAIS